MYYDVQWLVVTTLFYVLHKAKHKIKTSYGVLDPVYYDEDTTIYVISQGNELGPALWALISSIIYKMCKARGHGLYITIAFSKQEFSCMGFAFCR